MDVPFQPQRRAELMAAVILELRKAYAKHGREPWTRHEFLGILREEYKELEAAIFTDAPNGDVTAELVQVIAMCFRFLETGDRHRGQYPPISSLLFNGRIPIGFTGQRVAPPDFARYQARASDPADPESHHLLERLNEAGQVTLEVEGFRIRGTAAWRAFDPDLAHNLAALLSAEEVEA